MARLSTLREEIRQPLPLGYHPLYRFYEGGALTRRFRGLPERPDDWVVGGLGGLVYVREQRRPRWPRPGRTGTRPGHPLPRAECGSTSPGERPPGPTDGQAK